MEKFYLLNLHLNFKGERERERAERDESRIRTNSTEHRPLLEVNSHCQKNSLPFMESEV
jgi:hypothetical protein